MLLFLGVLLLLGGVRQYSQFPKPFLLLLLGLLLAVLFGLRVAVVILGVEFRMGLKLRTPAFVPDVSDSQVDKPGKAECKSEADDKDDEDC